jgi:aminopeptidase N
MLPLQLTAQLGRGKDTFTRADSLRGSIGPERAWWDVMHYDVWVKPDLATRSIQGRTKITFEALSDGRRMQIDLQQPLVVDSILVEITTEHATGHTSGLHRLDHEREGHVLWVDLPDSVRAGTRMPMHIHYHGVPREARNPPWDGGWIWRKDGLGNPWVSVACQGLGASVWYPCKDHQSDEPDEGATLRITVPDSLQAIGNGRLEGVVDHGDGTHTWQWTVTAPINTYNLAPYIGKYVHIADAYAGMEGRLDLDHWVLAHNEAKARRHFQQVHAMLDCFEAWLGAYPFHADSYKLVEAPHLGMEHQSAIAYGNGYHNGYRGMDLSGTGHGLGWDYIIVHESGHEWFGNSITTADIADMWVHEGFTMYTEALFVECRSGKEAASEYVVGIRGNINNDRPIIGPMGVNAEGSGDMYPKGANLVHMVRQVLGDSAFKVMLLEMGRRYRHSIVTSTEIENFMNGYSMHDLQPMLDMYLRDTRIPVLEWGIHMGRLKCRWAGVDTDFRMPVRLLVDESATALLDVGTGWTELPDKVVRQARVQVSPDWYVRSRRVSRATLKR